MGKVNWRLASGSVSSGSSSKLSPSSGLVSVSAGAGVSAPMISAEGARVKHYDMAVPDIVRDKSMDAAAVVADQIVDAAFKYRDRVDQLEADESVLKFQKSLRELYVGKKDDSGKVIGGYSTLQAKAALDSFPQYQTGVDSAFESALAGKSNSVKVKMILRVKQAKEAAIERGVNHQQRELKRQEGNVRAEEKQFILQDIELNGVSPFTNGTIDTHLSKYENPEERFAAQEFLAKNAMYMVYNDTLEKAYSNKADITPAVTAYEATASAFQEIRSGLNEDVENSIQNWIGNQKNLAISQAKAAKKENEGRLRNEIRRQAPTQFASSIANGNWGVFNSEVKGFRSVFKNSEKGYKDALDSVKDGFAVAVNRLGGVTLSDKMQYAHATMSHMIAHTDAFDEVEKMQLLNFATIDLPSKIARVQNSGDHMLLVSAERALLDGKNPGPAPTNMLVENQNKWDKMVNTYSARKRGERGTVSSIKKEQAGGIVEVYKSRIRRGEPLTDSQIDKASAMAVDGLIDEGVYSSLVEQSKGLESGKLKTPVFAKRPEFKLANDRLKNVSYALASGSGVKPAKKPTPSNWTEKKAMAYDEFKSAADVQYSTAYNAMYEAAKKAEASGKPFDADTWVDGYVKTVVNRNSILNRKVGIWDVVTGVFESDMDEPNFFTGEYPSIMDELEQDNE